MRRKQGFTLIELLAVIVILAVIALIATPIIIGIIEDSRKSAFKSSLYSIFDAAEYKLVQDKNTEFPSVGIDVPSLSMNNNKFTSGLVYQDDKGMYLENVTDGKYCGNGYKDKLKVTKGECIKYTDESAFTFDKETGTITGFDGSVEKITIPRTIDGIEVKHIGAYSFYGFSITSITIPNTVISIEEAAFDGGYSIEDVVIPNSVTSIGDFAFSGNLLTKITIPDSVINIGMGAFQNNILTSVNIPPTVTSIGDFAFSGNLLTKITIPDSVINIGAGVFNDNQLPDEQAFVYMRNSDGSEDKTTIISYGGAKRDNIIIPSGITKIEYAAFHGSKINSVVIPNTVTTIGISAFFVNNISNIIIPSSVISIDNSAFANNPLTSVKIIGKSSPTDFTTYKNNIWSWAPGYSDSNITWNAVE